MFITLYGINNIGKSTHAKRIVERLKENGKDAVYLKYPIYDLEPSGKIINETIRSNKQEMSEEELQMWFVLNRFQYEAELRKLLAEGKWVIAEDYIWTGIAWGMTKGADREWLESINKPLLQEDVAILMYGARQMVAKEDVHVHEGNNELVDRCQAYFMSFAEKLHWPTVQLQEEMDDTHALLWNIIEKFL